MLLKTATNLRTDQPPDGLSKRLIKSHKHDYNCITNISAFLSFLSNPGWSRQFYLSLVWLWRVLNVDDLRCLKYRLAFGFVSASCFFFTIFSRTFSYLKDFGKLTDRNIPIQIPFEPICIKFTWARFDVYDPGRFFIIIGNWTPSGSFSAFQYQNAIERSKEGEAPRWAVSLIAGMLFHFFGWPQQLLVLFVKFLSFTLEIRQLFLLSSSLSPLLLSPCCSPCFSSLEMETVDVLTQLLSWSREKDLNPVRLRIKSLRFSWPQCNVYDEASVFHGSGDPAVLFGNPLFKICEISSYSFRNPPA